MENYTWVIWVAIIAIGMISSANKAKKRKEEAEQAARRRAQQYESNPFPMPEEETPYMPEPEGRYGRKSLGEILEELANPQRQTSIPEPEPEFIEGRSGRSTSSGRSYTLTTQELVYEEGRGAQSEIFYSEGGRVTKDPAPARPGRTGINTATEAPGAKDNYANPEKSREKGDSNPMKEILGGEFDLRRAIVESEILNPKYF